MKKLRRTSRPGPDGFADGLGIQSDLKARSVWGVVSTFSGAEYHADMTYDEAMEFASDQCQEGYDAVVVLAVAKFTLDFTLREE
jgi:hypothetical protein